MLRLPQPFANCYILLFSLSEGEKSELLGRGWGGCRNEGGWLCGLDSPPLSPACLSVCLCLTLGPSYRVDRLHEHAHTGEFLSSLWSADNEAIVVWQRYIDTLTQADWAFLFLSAPWYSQIHSCDAVQGGDRGEDGVRERREEREKG